MLPTDAIQALRDRGLSDAAIGALIGVNQSTVSRIRRGQAPSYAVGKALIDAAMGGPAPAVSPAIPKRPTPAIPGGAAAPVPEEEAA